MGGKITLKKGQAGLNRLYNTYRIASKRRGLEFTLTKAQFKKLTSGDCFYCGKAPESVFFEHNTGEKSREHGKYFYNGIDRVDNTKGYIKSNCVTCCKEHNQWKKAMPYYDFIKNIINTANHLINKGFKV